MTDKGARTPRCVYVFVIVTFTFASSGAQTGCNGLYNGGHTDERFTLRCQNSNLIDITSNTHMRRKRSDSCKKEIMNWRLEIRNCNGQTECRIHSSPEGSCGFLPRRSRNYEEICYECKMFDRKCADENLTLRCPGHYLIKVTEVEVGTASTNEGCKNARSKCKDIGSGPAPHDLSKRQIDSRYDSSNPADINERFRDLQKLCNKKQNCSILVYLYPGGKCRGEDPYNYEKVTYECEYNLHTTQAPTTTIKQDETTETRSAETVTTRGTSTQYAMTQKVSTQDGTNGISNHSITIPENVTSISIETPTEITSHGSITQIIPASTAASRGEITTFNEASVTEKMASHTSLTVTVVPTVLGIMALVILLVLLVIFVLRRRRRRMEYDETDKRTADNTHSNVAFTNEGEGKVDINIKTVNKEVNGKELNVTAVQLIYNDIYNTGTGMPPTVVKGDPQFAIKHESKNGDAYAIVEKTFKNDKKLDTEKQENIKDTSKDNDKSIDENILPRETYELTTLSHERNLMGEKTNSNGPTDQTKGTLNNYEYDTSVDVNSKYVDVEHMTKGVKSNGPKNVQANVDYESQLDVLPGYTTVEGNNLDSQGIENYSEVDLQEERKAQDPANVTYDSPIDVQTQYVSEKMKSHVEDQANVNAQPEHISESPMNPITDNPVANDEIKANDEQFYDKLAMGKNNKKNNVPREVHTSENYSFLNNQNNSKSQNYSEIKPSRNPQACLYNCDNEGTSHINRQQKDSNMEMIQMNDIKMVDNELYSDGKF